jgi:hypothetical protein
LEANMKSSGPERARSPRRGAERDAAQPITGSPRSGEDEDHLEPAEDVRSPLTAKEFELGTGKKNRDAEKPPEDDSR